MDVRIVVGKNLRRFRLERGLSQEALAHEAGIVTSFLSQIENGKRSPTITTLQGLAEALGVSIADFFSVSTSTEKGLPRGRRKEKTRKR